MKRSNYLRRSGRCAYLLFCLFLISCSTLKPVNNRIKHQARAGEPEDQALIDKYESIIGAPIDAGKSLGLYRAIDGWMGAPYQFGGMSKAGTDCSGFTSALYQEVYHIRLQHSSVGQLENDVTIISKRNLQEGDLVFFCIEDGKKVSHVGIYLGNNKFVHASAKKGVCINDMTERYYEQHFKKAGRVKLLPATGTRSS